MDFFLYFWHISHSHSNSSITQRNVSMRQLKDVWHAILTKTLISIGYLSYLRVYWQVFEGFLHISLNTTRLFQLSGGFLIAKYTCKTLDQVQDQLLKNMLCHRKISFILDDED